MVSVELATVDAGGGASIRLRVRNGSTEPVAFTPIQLVSPSLAYEVVDAEDRPVPMPPPPVPDPSAEPVVLPPGESWETVHVLVVPPDAPPGRYRIRARVFLRGAPEPAFSDWHDVHH